MLVRAISGGAFASPTPVTVIPRTGASAPGRLTTVGRAHAPTRAARHGARVARTAALRDLIGMVSPCERAARHNGAGSGSTMRCGRASRKRGRAYVTIALD